MSEVLILLVEMCEWVGKGVFCVLCCEGCVFVVVYGGNEELLLIYVEEKELCC